MKDSSLVGPSKTMELLKKIRNFQLVVACFVLVFCFLACADLYAAKTVAERHRGMFNGNRRVVNYAEVAKLNEMRSHYLTNQKKRYLIDPKAAQQPNMMSVLAGGGDKCPSPLSFFPNPLIGSLPFSDVGTTTGFVDDYDVNADGVGCPGCSITNGIYPDPGYYYGGSGAGPDVAYRIAFSATANINITMNPTDDDTPPQNPNGDDMTLLVYGDKCINADSSQVAPIAIADNSGNAIPPDLPDNSEFISIIGLPAGMYHIVVDTYTAPGDTTTTGGYSLNVVCTPSQTCTQPIPPRTRRP